MSGLSVRCDRGVDNVDFTADPWNWGDLLFSFYAGFEPDDPTLFGFTRDHVTVMVFREACRGMWHRVGFDVLLVPHGDCFRFPAVFRRPGETDDELMWRVMVSDFKTTTERKADHREDPKLPTRLRLLNKPQLWDFYGGAPNDHLGSWCPVRFEIKPPYVPGRPAVWGVSGTQIPDTLFEPHRRLLDWIIENRLVNRMNPIR